MLGSSAARRTTAGGGCDNNVRVKIDIAERHLLDVIREEILSPEGIAAAEKLYRAQVKLAAKEPQRPATGKPAARLARKQTEIAQLRALMNSGTLSEAVAKAAIDQAEGELSTLQAPPKVDERETARVVRMLPRVAEALRERVALPNLGLRDPRSILQRRNALFGMFGGKVPLRPVLDTERPYLVARVGINRTALLDSCRLTGSGGLLFGCEQSTHPPRCPERPKEIGPSGKQKPHRRAAEGTALGRSRINEKAPEVRAEALLRSGSGGALVVLVCATSPQDWVARQACQK